MPKLPRSNRLFFVMLIAAVLTSCSKSDDKAGQNALDNTLLQHIPANTPYLFVNPQPLPDDVLDKLEPGVDATLRAYAKIIRAVVGAEFEIATTEGAIDDAGIARIDALSEELASLMTLDGIRAAGIGRESTMVFYGEGLLPVFRMRLTDSALMEQTISRIETKVGNKMATGLVGQQSYRHAGDEKGRLILALVENDLVVSLVPANHTDELLKSVLGLSKPENSIVDSGELQELLTANSFEPYYLLILDVTRLASTFLDEQSGTNAELLALMEYDGTVLSDVCKAEVREMAAIAPRVVAGYTQLNSEQISSNLIIELRQDIAAGVATLVAPVQGLGLTKGGLFSFGMSLDILAAREFYSARLDAMEADPFECEEFAELQAGVAQGRELLKQPIPPIAYSVKGFLAVVDALEGMDLAKQQPPTSVDASFLLAVDNPQGLLAMGALFSPEIAALDLQADGKPKKLELPPASPAMSEAYIAMTDNALAISVGQGGEDRIVELFDKDFDYPSPFMSMFMDAGQYYSFIADTMSFAQPADSQLNAEITEGMSEMMRAMESWFGETSVKVNFTERGIEVPSTVKFAESK